MDAVKRKKRFLFTCATLLLCAAALAFCACASPVPKEKTYLVSINLSDRVTLIGEPIVRVARGESVAFELELDEGYGVRAVSHGVYRDGVLTVYNVTQPLTVTVDAAPYIQMLSDTVKNGKVEAFFAADTQRDLLYEGDEILLRAVPRSPEYYVDRFTIDNQNVDFEAEIDGSVTVSTVYHEGLTYGAQILGNPYSLLLRPIAHGSIDTGTSDGIVRYGDILDIKCYPDDGYRASTVYFNGRYLLPQADEVQVEITGNTMIGAQFVDAATPATTYDPNGGVWVSDEPPIVQDTYRDNFYIDNCIGKLQRPGYLLICFNTAPDGSGEAHNLGAMLPASDRSATLYAQWQKESPAEYFVYDLDDASKTAAIRGLSDAGYAARPAVLAIPQTIDGYCVTQIAAAAFQGCDFVGDLYLPHTLTKVGAKACARMTALTRITLYDSLANLSVDAFDGSDAIVTLRLNSATPRAYENKVESSFADKVEQLKALKGQKKIVSLSGCSMARGVQSALLQTDPVLAEYAILHMGVHASGNIYFYLPQILPYLEDGDIFLWSPEYYSSQFGSDAHVNQYYSLTVAECNYDMIGDVNISENASTRGFLTSLPQFLSSRLTFAREGKIYYNTSDGVRGQVNEYGEFVYPRVSQHQSMWSSNQIADVWLLKDGAATLCAYFDAHLKPVIDRGVRLYHMYPPQCVYADANSANGSFEADAPLREEFHRQLQTILSRYGGVSISTPEKSYLPVKYAYDHPYHMTNEGTRVYTETVLKPALIEQLKKDGLYVVGGTK